MSCIGLIVNLSNIMLDNLFKIIFKTYRIGKEEVIIVFRILQKGGGDSLNDLK